jgi:hypothetical protein
LGLLESVPTAVISRALSGRTALETLTILRATPKAARRHLLGAVEEPLRTALAASAGDGESSDGAGGEKGRQLYEQFLEALSRAE